MKIVVKIFRMAAAQGFEASDDLVSQVSSMFRTFGQSNIIELAVNSSRRAERASYTKRMADLRRWETLVSSSVSDGWFRYEQSKNWESEIVPRGLFNDKVHPAFFGSKVAEASMSFAPIVSSSPKPSWHSPAPKGEIQFAADLALCRKCQRSDMWHRAPKVWLGCLLPDGNFMVRRKRSSGCPGPWFISLGDAGVSGKIGWPVKTITFNNVTHFIPDPDAGPKDLIWIFIMDLGEWEAAELDWLSPLGLASSFRRRVELREGMLARMVGAPDSLLKCAAKRAFFRLPRTALLQVAREAHCSVESSLPLFEILFTMVKEVLDAGDDEVLRILEARLEERDFAQLEEWLASDGMDWLGKDDQKEVADEVKKGAFGMAATNSTKAEIKEALLNKRQSIKASAKKAPKPGRGGSSAPPPKRYPQAFPDLAAVKVTDALVQGLLPIGYRIFGDTYNRRWEMSCRVGKSRRSRSWQLYGVEQSAQMLVAHAWWSHQQMTGEACPMAGILPAPLAS